jgi:hypothetical protein
MEFSMSHFAFISKITHAYIKYQLIALEQLSIYVLRQTFGFITYCVSQYDSSYITLGHWLSSLLSELVIVNGGL